MTHSFLKESLSARFSKSVFVITIVLLLPVLGVQGQQFKPEKTFSFNADYFTVDNLANVYSINGGTISMADSSGNIKHSFSNKSAGSLNFIDAVNPLRIMAYARDFSLIYFLDNQLAVQSTIDLRNQLLTDAWPVCNSNNEGFWIVNPQENTIVKYDYTLKIIAQSQPLNLLVADDIKPLALQENDRWLVLHNDKNGLMIFDRLGSYFKTVRDETIECFFMSEKNMVYFSDGAFVFVDLETGSEIKRIKTGITNVKGIYWLHDKIYVLSQSQITLFSITG